MAKIITLDEVKKHNSDNSVWMVIHNDVYDVTKYLEEHPGGADPLLDVAGKDGTQDFEDVGHSEDARELMTKFKIGTLPASERAKVVNDCCRPISKWKKIKSRTKLGKSESNKDNKSWRTYDGSTSSQHVVAKSEYKPPCSPKVEKRVQTIVVPRESSNLKWAIIALAGALVIGIALKKYLG